MCWSIKGALFQMYKPDTIISVKLWWLFPWPTIENIAVLTIFSLQDHVKDGFKEQNLAYELLGTKQTLWPYIGVVEQGTVNREDQGLRHLQLFHKLGNFFQPIFAVFFESDIQTVGSYLVPFIRCKEVNNPKQGNVKVCRGLV